MYLCPTGADTNTFTQAQSKSTPWAHFPGDPNATSNAAAHTQVSGEVYIFCGGGSWTVTGTWTVTHGGTSAQSFVLGVDVTWYTGTSFVNPVITGGNSTNTGFVSSCTNDDSAIASFIHVNQVADWLIFGFNFTGACWTTGGGPLYIYVAGETAQNGTIALNYFHGWSMKNTANDGLYGIDVSEPSGTADGNAAIQNVFDGSDSSAGAANSGLCNYANYSNQPCYSGGAIYGGMQTAWGNVFRHLSNAAVTTNTTSLHDNWWDDLTVTFQAAGQHTNCWNMDSQQAGASVSVYNNLVTNIKATECFYLTVGNGGSIHFFNNVLWGNMNYGNGTSPANCVLLNNAVTGGTGTFYAYNNTISQLGGNGGGCQFQFAPVNGPIAAWNGPAYFANNHLIGLTALSGVYTIASGASATITDNGGEVFQTEGAANSQGFTTANNYAPTLSSAVTVGTGINITSSCSQFSTDYALCFTTSGAVAELNGKAIYTPPQTPRTTDAGAYQFCCAPGNQKVYVVFPPESGTTNTHFTTYVMPQPAIAGVSDQFMWENQETTTAGSLNTPCANPGTDTCQQDSFGLYHTYNFSSTGGSTSADNILAKWFSTSSGWGTKTVNFFPIAQTNGPNSATPYYLTTSTWTSVTGTQHYINAAKDTCSQDSGAPIASGKVSRTSPSSTATVTLNNSYNAGDTIWLYGFSGPDTSFNIQTPTGTTVISANSTSFTYASNGTSTLTSSTSGFVESQQQSWFVPTDPGYVAAVEAYYAAAVYHFNNSPNLSQIGYMRTGVRGAEWVMLCPDQMVADGVPGYANQAQAKTTWLNAYQAIVTYINTLNPQFQVLSALNPGWTTTNQDYTYGLAEAQSAVTGINANGLRNGFGSQGLQQTDITNYSIPPINYCAADWCEPANDYWAQGTVSPGIQPIEGQQIDCSDPLTVWINGIWATGNQGVSCFQLGSGTTSKSKTGDLRVLLPFEKSKHLGYLELYNIDALLAYDPTYCVVSDGACSTGSVSAAVYGMRCVGPTQFADSSCPNGVGGDGTYGAAINSFAGLGYQVGCTTTTCATGSFTIGTNTVAKPNYAAKATVCLPGAATCSIIQTDPNFTVLGGATGANTCYTPIDFGIPICKLTDINWDPTQTGKTGGGDTFTNNSADAHHMISNDGKLASFAGTSGYSYVGALTYSGSSPFVSMAHIYPTNSSWSSHGGWFLNFKTDGGWSWSQPETLFLRATGGIPLIQSYNFLGFAGNPGGAPTVTSVFDARAGQSGPWGTTSSNCLPATGGYTSNNWQSLSDTSKTPADQFFEMGLSIIVGLDAGIDTITVTNGSKAFTVTGSQALDTTGTLTNALAKINGVLAAYAIATVNAGGMSGTLTTSWAGANGTYTFSIPTDQGTGEDVFFYSVGQGCVHLNTGSGMVTADYGYNGVVNGSTDRFTLHGTKIIPSGTGFVMSTNNCIPGTCTNPSPMGYAYIVSTGTLLNLCASPNDCGGHNALGFNYIVNNGIPTPGAEIRPYASLPSFREMTVNPPVPFTNCVIGQNDNHIEWSDVDLLDSWPFMVTTEATNSGAQVPGSYTCPLVNEIYALDPTLGTIFRFGHSLTTGLSWSYAVQNVISNVSDSGQYLLFPSDWNALLGRQDNGAGTCTPSTSGAAGCRGDVFMIGPLF